MAHSPSSNEVLGAVAGWYGLYVYGQYMAINVKYNELCWHRGKGFRKVEKDAEERMLEEIPRLID